MLWLLSFLVVRVLPVPYILYVYATELVLHRGCAFGTGEWIVALLTVPIPLGLNLFWFYKIVSKAMRMLNPKPKADA